MTYRKQLQTYYPLPLPISLQNFWNSHLMIWSATSSNSWSRSRVSSAKHLVARFVPHKAVTFSSRHAANTTSPWATRCPGQAKSSRLSTCQVPIHLLLSLISRSTVFIYWIRTTTHLPSDRKNQSSRQISPWTEVCLLRSRISHSTASSLL